MSSAEPRPLPIESLYSDHHNWLNAWLRRRLGNAFDAADLAHDVYLRLLQKPREFDSFDGARAYLSTMAKGMCADLWRRREIERAWLDALAARPVTLEPSAEQRALAIDALCEVDRMLRQLPARAAKAFILSQVYGLTYREIAAELKVSDRMVKKYMAQAMLHCALIETALLAD